MLSLIRKLLNKDGVQLAAIEGNEKIAKLQYVGDAQKYPNTVLDTFSLIQWEIYSDPVQFFDRGKPLGWGYLGDIAGVTVNISRNVKTSDPEIDPSSDNNEPTGDPEGFNIIGTAKRIVGNVPKFQRIRRDQIVPVAIVKGEGLIKEIHFDYATKIEDGLCVYRTEGRFKIIAGSEIEIVMPDGTQGTGYICDHSGQTITIKRSVKVIGYLRDKKGKIITGADGNPVEVDTKINWSGRLGKKTTNDKITILWNIASSGKDKLIFGAGLFILGNLIGVVLHI